MTTNIKIAVGAVGGAVAGFLVGYVVTKAKTKNAVADALEAQRANYEHLEAKMKEKAASEEVESDESEEEPVVTEEKEGYGRDVVSASNLRQRERDQTAYHKMVQEEEYGGYDNPGEGVYEASPYLIEEETYSETRLTYDKETLVWYEVDKMLMREGKDLHDDDPPDISRDIGWTSLQAFVDNPELEEIYVRNDGQGTDYLVTRVRVPYNEIER